MSAEPAGCPNADHHTPPPEGYMQWHAWAELKSATHKQQRCPSCGLFQIWVPKLAAAETA